VAGSGRSIPGAARATSAYHRAMANPRWTLWLIWAVMLASLSLYVVVPLFLPPRSGVWYEAQVSVVRFVLALFSLAAGVGSFALREGLVMRGLRAGLLDPATPEGFARVRLTLILLWALCELVAVFGLVISIGSGEPSLGWPFVASAAALMLFHAPHAAWFERPADTAR
jgi:F0F1-type ATP synthase membrane subunit c/vacuolar-type H+-ATPase subunit K